MAVPITESGPPIFASVTSAVFIIVPKVLITPMGTATAGAPTAVGTGIALRAEITIFVGSIILFIVVVILSNVSIGFSSGSKALMTAFLVSIIGFKLSSI